jgi:hypothetical protein
LSHGWANGYELTLARDFVEHLDTLPEGETGRVVFDVAGTDTASGALAAQVRTAVRRQTVLGLMAELGIPARVKSLGLKRGIKLIALDLSGL